MRSDDLKKIKRLVVAEILTAILAMAAFGVAIADINAAADSVRVSRISAARDSCYLIRGLVYAATTHAPRQRAGASAYIRHTPLRDCGLYARRTVRDARK